jgi:hypothetical protein
MDEPALLQWACFQRRSLGYLQNRSRRLGVGIFRSANTRYILVVKWGADGSKIYTSVFLEESRLPGWR